MKKPRNIAKYVSKPGAQVDAEVLEQLASAIADARAFCPTGAGGGVDNSCGSGKNSGMDEATGLPLNKDGTVTVYHHTSAANAEKIKASGTLKAAGEPHVYVTTQSATDTGYGDTAVPIRVNPKDLELDDEFPDGRKDYKISVGRPGGEKKVSIGSSSPGGGLREPQSTHEVKLPKDPKKLTVSQAAEAMKKLGYKVGKSSFSAKDKSTTFSVSDSDGKSTSLSADDMKRIIYENHADPAVAATKISKARRR